MKIKVGHLPYVIIFATLFWVKVPVAFAILLISMLISKVKKRN